MDPVQIIIAIACAIGALVALYFIIAAIAFSIFAKKAKSFVGGVHKRADTFRSRNQR